MSEQASFDPQGTPGTPHRLSDLADGERVSGVFAVRERERRTKKNGEPWLRLIVSNRTGSIEAISWDEAEARHAIAEPGTAVQIEGRCEVHERFGRKIVIEAIRPAAEGEYDPAELIPCSEVPIERLEADLRELLATIQSPPLRELLARFFGEGSPIWQRFREAPAAKYYHQAYRHGLLEHTLSVAQGVSAAAAYFPGIDRDVAISGALLHDIGKIEAYNDDPMAIDLTDTGKLEGEIPRGYYMVRRAIEAIDGFPPAIGQAVLHIVLSHHGALEHGSPVVPATREAILVHMIDHLGGKLGSFDRIERELPEGETWSRKDQGIGGPAFFGSRAA